MSLRRPLLLFASAAAAASLALAGCSSSGGSNSEGGSSGGASTSAPASSPSAQSSLAALVPASVKSKGAVTVAMDATYPPDESLASDGKTIIGFDADLGKALVQALGLKANLQNVKFDNIIPGLQDGKYDVGLSSFGDTKEREKIIDFVTYFKAGESFYVKSGGKKYNGLASLCGAKVAVESGTTEQSDAQAQSKKCTQGGKPAIKILTFGDQNAANLAVSSGRADLGFADSQVVSYIVKQSHGQFEQTGSPINVVPYGIALPKGNGMAKAVLAAMKALISDGTYTKILGKWGLQTGAISNPVINGAVS